MVATALGVLAFDDGSTFDLDGDAVIGRDPAIDARVTAGTASPIPLDDPDGTVSRVHAEIRIVDGRAELIDRESTNGTHIWDDDLNVWARLVPGQPRPLAPGACGSIGPMMFVFEPPPAAPAPLGHVTSLLVTQDGALYPLDRAYVIGRDPLSDDSVRHAVASPIAIRDEQAARVHAHVSIDGDLVYVRDAGTPRGTHIAPPGSSAAEPGAWQQVGEAATELKPGWNLRVGTHVLTYRLDLGRASPAPTDTVPAPGSAPADAVSEPAGRSLPLPMALTRLMIRPPRAPLWCTPAEVGLAYEDVVFEATDGVEIKGWFVPRTGTSPGPAVVFVHGWLWNRLGNVAGRVPFTDRSVDFLPATRALHDAGYHVLLIDLSNHGESGSRFPVTYGPWEARDYHGALGYLRSRPDVDATRLGALGCSMGGNILLYGTPDCQPVKALLAIQPAVLPNFNRRFARELLGPTGPTMVKSAEGLYAVKGAPRPSKHNPAIPAADLGDTIVQYVQGTGDPWGSMEDVEAMVAATPNVLPLVRFPSTGRYEGYRYVSEAVGDVVGFFREHL